MKIKFFLSIFIVAISSCVNAGDWTIQVGGLWAKTDSWISTKGLFDEDLKLDFEDKLKLEDQQFLPFIHVAYQFNQRHHIYADWRRLNRSSESKTTVGFTVPNEPEYAVLVGSNIRTRLDIDIYQIGYGYIFYQGERTEFAVSGGLHIMDVGLGFSGEIAGCVENESGGTCSSISTNGEIINEQMSAPLPDIGLWGSYQLSEHFFLFSHPQLFYVDIDNFQGYLLDLNAELSYRINDSWNVEIGYSYYVIEAELGNSNLKYTYQGPTFNVAYSF